tara:strand:- start:21 stop:398 length:378 start_codon:yes stop_codon:yes gene_type:complete
MKEMETQSDIKVEYSSKKVYTYLDNLGSLLLITSILVTFAPTILPFETTVSESIAWFYRGITIFVLAIIVLVVTNSFRFFSKNDYEDEDSDSDISWSTIIKIQLLIGVIMFAFMFFIISTFLGGI